MGITGSTIAPIASTPKVLITPSTTPLFYSFPDCVNGPLNTSLVCNTTATPLERATALVNLFTVAELVNNTQNESPGVPRLGLPEYQWWSEALVLPYTTMIKFLTLTTNY